MRRAEVFIRLGSKGTFVKVMDFEIRSPCAMRVRGTPEKKGKLT